MSASEIANKVWNYIHILYDDGMGYGDYVEQITYLIFLNMADERGGVPSPQSSPEHPHLGPLPEGGVDVMRPAVQENINVVEPGYREQPNPDF